MIRIPVLATWAVVACSLFFPICAAAQQTFPIAAPSDVREGCFALTNATIYVDYQTRIEGATLIIRKGYVEAVGVNVAIPADAAVVDCTEKIIYPAFIDLYGAGYGLPAPAAPGTAPRQLPQQYTNKKGVYAWNEAIRPEFNATDNFANDLKAGDEWRKLGFATLLTHRADGISRGTGALVSLSSLSEHENIFSGIATHQLSFRKGTSTQDYPSSLMGCIALLRQTMLDAQWYKAEGFKTEQNRSLEAWNQAQAYPQIFEASDKLDVLRIGRLGQEFGVKYIVKTNGDEYQRLPEIKALGYGLIVPLNFPEGYDVRDPYNAQDFSIAQLKHWELAPSNPARLAKEGIPFALTTAGLKDKSKFYEQLRKAIESGLSEEAALKALTFQPAQMIGAYSQVGSLEKGKVASFVITSGNIFKANSKILHTWVKGKPFVQKNLSDILPNGFYGEYLLEGPGLSKDKLFIENTNDAPNAFYLRADSTKQKINLTTSGNTLTISIVQDTISKKNVLLSGLMQSFTGVGIAATGNGTQPDGQWFAWTLTRVKSILPVPKKEAPVKIPEAPGDLIYPLTAFGWKEKPAQQSVLIQNATVWTNEKEGVLKNTDVLFSAGTIVKIGTKLTAPDRNTLIVDGTNKHLTAGIIDEHSHIAIARSVNEGTQESTAEVRIGDVLDSEDIDIYRQLAGGVTSSHLLHGSANPIGGQTQLIKLRWGSAPEDLKFQNWPGFIKFALGENVKQANWGDEYRTRYPQTRMGVEQVYVDYFTRAQEYLALKKSGKPYRRDLDLDALGEILEKKRFITCHSYVQSEITMMMRVAERFGFRLNTFTHILEGYKVADKMAKHGAGGSSFSDWWAYKMEVGEAIPYNAAIMHKQGVTVAINSDDAEMARRLNQEAAKTVMYGGMSEEEAWKTVTLNPAKLLHVEDRVGSIKAGKDADLVLWNAHPLSVYAQAQTTWVDGIRYYDKQEDARRSAELRAERARLIQKIQKSGKGGPGGEKPATPKHYYHCDSEEDEG